MIHSHFVSLRVGLSIVGLCGGLFCLALTGCKQNAEAAPAAQPLLPVNVSLPAEEQITDFEYFTGRLEGSESVEVRTARVNGYLKDIHFEPGHFIKKGDPLFDIDDRPYKASYDVAAAQVTRAQVLYTRLTSDYERNKPLAEDRTITREQFDKIVSDRNEAYAAYEAAKAALEKARLDWEFTKIKSPTDGIVSRENVSRGNLVTADQTLLTTVVKPDPIYVDFDIDENVVLRILELIKEGKFQSARQYKVPIRMKVGSGEDYIHEGFVNFVDNRLDPNTGTMRIRGEFANPQLANGSVAFSPGMFARVQLALGPPYKALLVSEKAISNNYDQKIVYVLDKEEVVRMKAVKLGTEFEGMRVMLSGIEPTDRIVVSNLLKIRPEMKVNPTLVPMPRRLKVETAAIKSTAEKQPATPPGKADPPTEKSAPVTAASQAAQPPSIPAQKSPATPPAQGTGK